MAEDRKVEEANLAEEEHIPQAVSALAVDLQKDPMDHLEEEVGLEGDRNVEPSYMEEIQDPPYQESHPPGSYY